MIRKISPPQDCCFFFKKKKSFSRTLSPSFSTYTCKDVILATKMRRNSPWQFCRRSLRLLHRHTTTPRHLRHGRIPGKPGTPPLANYFCWLLDSIYFKKFFVAKLLEGRVLSSFILRHTSSSSNTSSPTVKPTQNPDLRNYPLQGGLVLVHQLHLPAPNAIHDLAEDTHVWCFRSK